MFLIDTGWRIAKIEKEEEGLDCKYNEPNALYPAYFYEMKMV